MRKKSDIQAVSVKGMLTGPVTMLYVVLRA